jgi:hypothetical protein
MATRKQKEDLLKALAFTPHKVEISLSGYGGEVVMGEVDKATYNYWNQQGTKKLTYFVQDCYDDRPCPVPGKYQFITPASWYECDDIAHAVGVEMSEHCRLTVYDPTQQHHLLECNLDPDSLKALGIQVQESQDVDIDSLTPGTAVFVGQNIEKGTFFSADIELTQPFDPKQLLITYSIYNGWMLAGDVVYRGNYLDGTDNYSTSGKSSNFEMLISNADLLKTSDSAEIVQNLADIDEAVMTNWFTFKKHKPVHLGQYQVILESTLYPIQFATWKNQQWQYDDSTPVELPVSAWRGLNYPTC